MSPPSSGNRRPNRTPCKAKLWRARNERIPLLPRIMGGSSGTGGEAHLERVSRHGEAAAEPKMAERAAAPVVSLSD
jgi:hypothetical protein